MPKTTIDYDPFLCDECNKYGYCLKSKTKMVEIIKEKQENKIENVPLILVMEKIECFS